MTYAIGDIHGCRVSLERLLETLPLNTEDAIICVGDYIDRGPDTNGVIDLLLALREKYQLHHLIGNHELFLRDALADQDIEFFTREKVGGKETIKSYGESINDIPEKHLNFLFQESLPFFETETHIFVHGGLDRDFPPSAQTLDILAWKRFHEAEPHYSGKTVICGHTTVGERPEMMGDHTIGIDTGSGKGGWLTALQVETGKYYQANEAGDVREGSL